MPKTVLKNQVRIVGGQWRGRKISFPAESQVRPTPDRVKETLFNWLAPEIRNAQCLELFAGSASLSFEALSRGAAKAVAVEKDFSTVEIISRNSEILNAKQLEIVQADCFHWLKTASPEKAFDIVFIDPPYALKGLQETFRLINTPIWLASDALIYFESDIPFTEEELPRNWEIIKNKKAGQVLYYLVRVSLE